MVANLQSQFSNALLEWKCLYSDWNFTDVCSYGFGLQHIGVDLDNSLGLFMIFMMILRKHTMYHMYTHIMQLSSQWSLHITITS